MVMLVYKVVVVVVVMVWPPVYLSHAHIEGLYISTEDDEGGIRHGHKSDDEIAAHARARARASNRLYLVSTSTSASTTTM